MKKILIVFVFVCLVILSGHVLWQDSVSNPDNAEIVIEIAFHLDIDPSEVTQNQFKASYGDSFIIKPHRNESK
jgi:hypothetical protein